MLVRDFFANVFMPEPRKKRPQRNHISKIAGLKWENVDLDKGRIHVRQAYVTGDLKRTKTGKNRSVNMLPQLRHALRIWAMKQQHATEGWVFPNQSGNAPINLNDLGARVIADTLKEAGLDWYSLYACRRGFGTMLVLAGATLDEVADAMGNSPDVVFRHYVKDKDSKLAAKGIEKLAAAMGGEFEPRLTANDRLLISGGK
jgi:integrase